MHERNNPIRILHLEDSPLDAELVLDRLEADGLKCTVVRVDSQAAFVTALSAGGFDLILCDYNLPDYDGLSALRLAQERHPLTPVLLISGSLGEEEAVRCLHHGATDYLLKQRLGRLPAAVKRALLEAGEHRKRRRAEAELSESEERFRQLAEQSTEGFWFMALNPQRILYVSPAVERIWDLPSEHFLRDPGALFAAIQHEDQPRVQRVLDACLQGLTPRFETEYRVVRPDGSVRRVLESGTPIRNAAGEVFRLHGVLRDVTEQREAEAHMLRTQRLESIGALAGGVVHDLNNALAPIMMAVELLRLEFPGTASECLDIIESGARRGAGLVKQLLRFAKGAEGERLNIQPQPLLQEIEKLVASTFPKSISLQSHHAADLWAIQGDSTQLHQVLLNLCVNARDAMPNGGTLTLQAENTLVDSGLVQGSPEPGPSRYVRVRVSDTGIGMAPEVLEHIFEPFFSTKGPDHGTGIGLSTVDRIVRGHGGFIRVRSEPGHGSTFEIHLPAAAPAALVDRRMPPSEPAFRGNGETILVVDDELAVRAMTQAVLTALNFRVTTASDGPEALVKASEYASEIRAVLTDCHMPRTNSLEFLQLLRARLPRAGIIVASGRFEEQDQAEFGRLDIRIVLEKPFTQEQLTHALERVFRK